MNKLELALAAAVAAAGCQKVDSEQPKPAPGADGDAVPIVTVPVAGSLYMLEGAGGNVGVLAGADGVLIVDDQMPFQAPGILEAVRKLGKGDPELVVNTHWHGDHTGGNESFGAGAHIIAHDNVRKRLATTQNVHGEVIEPLEPRGLPVVTFAESVTLHFNGEEVRVVHFPHGHTDGDSIVFFTGTNAVHMGDHFFNGMFPFVDLATGGNAVEYAANVAKVIAQLKDDTKVIPGHGKLATKADLVAFHAMLVDTIDIVRKAKAAGRTIDQVKKAGLPAKYKPLSGDFVNTEFWIETIYASL